ncbi:MAG: orotate phosphoribosyltransferase [Candidatus Neomarinimicrobiota bacterium]|nr:MAG: orotate phosphoribosyltransferase [Candidatus Marinimicrobia bacterium TMED108]RCL89687.1 MAG: orotate phosphoribosyltransferase [bacterium]|tara:strand:+ start:1728 stop:2306 length:579 start_codon:yes stop_codon:yes gene_type:complete
MNSEEYIKIFKDSGALLDGHFILTSGRHSSSYFQCAKLLQYPKYLELFSKNIADHFKENEIDLVVSPAIGGIVLGTEVGRLLRKRTVFAERVDGEMKLRRGFEIKTNEKILIVEDVITTGGSVKEVMRLVQSFGADIIGVGVIVDRSSGSVVLHENQLSLAALEVKSYDSSDVPSELASIPVQKPGSRSLVK